jgi:hypothetical protein
VSFDLCFKMICSINESLFLSSDVRAHKGTTMIEIIDRSHSQSAVRPPPLTRQLTFGSLPSADSVSASPNQSITQSTNSQPLTARLSEKFTDRTVLSSVSSHLFIYHLVNLFITLFTSIWYIIQYENQSTVVVDQASNQTDPPTSQSNNKSTKQLQVSMCFFFLCFHTAKSIISLALLAIPYFQRSTI